MFYYPQILLRTVHTPVFTITHRNTTDRTELSMSQVSRTDKTRRNTVYSAASRRKNSFLPLTIIQSRVFRTGLEWYRALNLRTRLLAGTATHVLPPTLLVTDWLAGGASHSHLLPHPSTTRYPYLTKSKSSLNLLAN